MKTKDLAVLGLALTVATPLSAKDKPLKTHDVGDGIKVDLPATWKLGYFVNPASNMPSMKKQGIKAWDYRADTGKLRIGITGMTFPGMAAKPMTPENEIEQFKRGMAQYVPISAEKAVTPTAFASGGIKGMHATLRTASGKPEFPVFFGRQFGCVTSAVAKRNDTLLIVSIGSDDCDGAEHKAALAAIAGAHE
jgi:hypothetical protein